MSTSTHYRYPLYEALESLRLSDVITYETIILGDVDLASYHLSLSEEDAAMAVRLAQCIEGIPSPRALGEQLKAIDARTDEELLRAWISALEESALPGFDFAGLQIEHILDHRLEVCRFVIAAAQA